MKSSMRSCILCYSILASLVLCQCAGGEIPSCNTPTTTDTLAAIGVLQASDIKAAQISFAFGANYRITYASNPQLVADLYKAISESGRLDSGFPGAENMLIVDQKDGSVAYLLFSFLDDENRNSYYIAGAMEHSPLLDSLINTLICDSNAANREARLGPLAIKTMHISVPGGGLSRVLSISKEYEKLHAKAIAILDCLDVRVIPTKIVDGNEIDKAQQKYGQMRLELAEPIKLDLYENADNLKPVSAPSKSEDVHKGFYMTLVRKSVECRSIIISEYGNYMPPSIILQTSNGYLLFDKLTRKEQEKYGIIDCKLPGHPAGDKIYYKSPKELYKELRSLIKTSYTKPSNLMPLK